MFDSKMIFFCQFHLTNNKFTGEAWQEIMLDCSARVNIVKCDKKSEDKDKDTCGSDMAFPYFISFYVLCSFLVSVHPFKNDELKRN